MPTIEEAKDYLGIDYDDDKSQKNIQNYIKLAEKYLTGCINNFDNFKDDERVKQLALFIIEDLYDRKSNTIKENSTLTKLKNSLIIQLQCEGRYGEL